MSAPIKGYQTDLSDPADAHIVTVTPKPLVDKVALDVEIVAGTVSGTFTPSGLTIGGRITEVTLSAAAWTALPDIGNLTDRNAIGVQNTSGTEIKIGYDSGEAGYVGMVVAGNGGERYYDISDGITIYAKSAAGAPVIVVEEIA